MRDLEHYPDNNPNVIIFGEDENDLIYGHKFLRQVIRSGESITAVTVRGLDIEVFVSYLQTHFPNYKCVKAIDDPNQITPEQLETISNAIPLTVGDAMYMRDIQMRL